MPLHHPSFGAQPTVVACGRSVPLRLTQATNIADVSTTQRPVVLGKRVAPDGVADGGAAPATAAAAAAVLPSKKKKKGAKVVAVTAEEKEAIKKTEEEATVRHSPPPP